MNVEYTGRHYEVTPTNRKEVEAGLSKIRKILRDRFDTKVVLAIEKHRHKAEITINSRVGPLVGLAQAKDMTAAIGEALDHLERQALKNKMANGATKPRLNPLPRSLLLPAKHNSFRWSCISFRQWRNQPRYT